MKIFGLFSRTPWSIEIEGASAFDGQQEFLAVENGRVPVVAIVAVGGVRLPRAGDGPAPIDQLANHRAAAGDRVRVN